MKSLFRYLAVGAVVLGAIVAIHAWTGSSSTAMVSEVQAQTSSLSPAPAPSPSPSLLQFHSPLPRPTPPAVPVPGEPPPPPPNPCSPGYWKNHTELWVGTAACDGYVSPCGGATGCDAILNDLQAKGPGSVVCRTAANDHLNNYFFTKDGTLPCTDEGSDE